MSERVEAIRRPSDRAFQLIAACQAAHFGDGLCAECVDAALAQAERERDELHQEKDGYVLEARHFERKYDEARAEVERLKIELAAFDKSGNYRRAHKAEAALAEAEREMEAMQGVNHTWSNRCALLEAALARVRAAWPKAFPFPEG